MFKKEVKVKDKWVIDRFESFSEERRGLGLVIRSVAKQMEWLEKNRRDFWREVEKKYGLDPHYAYTYDFKTKTIKQEYRRVAAK